MSRPIVAQHGEDGLNEGTATRNHRQPKYHLGQSSTRLVKLANASDQFDLNSKLRFAKDMVANHSARSLREQLTILSKLRIGKGLKRIIKSVETNLRCAGVGFRHSLILRC
jgi:hypothetical protein